MEAVPDEFGDDRDFDKRDTVGSPSVWHWGEGTQFLPIQVRTCTSWYSVAACQWQCRDCMLSNRIDNVYV